MAVLCKLCGAEALDDALFCEACGQKLESPAADAVPTVACPACGTANPPDSAFCEECGGAIPDGAEKGGRKPGFLGLAAKAGAAGIGLGGAGVGLSSVLGGGGGAAAAGGAGAAASGAAGAAASGAAGAAASGAGAGAAEAGSEAAAEALGHAAGDAAGSIGGTPGGPLAGGPGGGAADGGLPHGGAQHFGTPHGGAPGGGAPGGTPGTPMSGTGPGFGDSPIKPDLTQGPSVHGPSGTEGSGASGSSGAGTSTGGGTGTSTGGSTGTSTGGGTGTSTGGGTGSATGGTPGGTATGTPPGGSTIGTPPGGSTVGTPPGGTTGTGFTPPGGHPHHHHHGGAGTAGAGVGAGAAAGGGLASGLGLLGLIIKWGLIGLITLIGVGLGASIVGGALIFTGKPSSCVNRPITPSAAASQALRDQWDQFEADAAAGKAVITFDEVGVTSRGVEYINEKDLPLKDLQVHFCPDGLGEATGTINTPGPDIHVVLRGTLDLSGAKPRIDVREIKAGNLPNLFGGTDWIINNIVKKSNADILDVEPHLTSIVIEDGSATLTGGP